MQTAAVSTILAPTCRNSQKGVKNLHTAAAANKKGLQHCDVTTRHQNLGSRQTQRQTPRLHIQCRRLPSSSSSTHWWCVGTATVCYSSHSSPATRRTWRTSAVREVRQTTVSMLRHVRIDHGLKKEADKLHCSPEQVDQ